MINHESQYDSSASGPSKPPVGSEEGSTVAASFAPLPPDGGEKASPLATVTSAGGSSVVRGAPADSSGSSVTPSISIGVTGSTPPALPTDKTVISKRPPIDLPLPPIPTPQSLGQALIGRTLDHYELVEFVGGGGMGAVFRSIDTRLGRTVAVKVLSRDHTDEETIKRFRNEAQSAARLDHPNIARVYFVGEAEGWNYIVFEYIEGTNLRDIVDARGPLPLEEALDYTLQVAEALDHASNRDVVHRDIKPSNVLVTPAGEVKLVDMGLARLHQVESSSEDLTASGVMLGTFDYISPEQARDPRSADVRSDIYSLGCTLYYMLAGRPPFPEGTAVQKLLKHNSEEPPDLRLFRPEVPPQVTSLVSRMLAKRPSQRQQSPQELISEVLSLAQQVGLSGLTRKTHVAIAPPPASSLWARALPIAVPIAALVLLLWLVDSLSRNGEQPLNLAQRPKLLPGAASQPAIDSQRTDSSADAAVAAGAKAGIPQGTENVGGPNIDDKASTDAATSGQGGIAAVSGNKNTVEGGQQTDVAPADQGGPDPSVGTNGQSLGPGVGSTGDPQQGPGSENSIGGSASPGGPNEKAKKITRIVVRKDPPTSVVAEDTQIVGTLALACQLAAEHSVAKIELEFTGPLESQPFDLTQSRVHIVAIDGHRPVIVFRPQQFGTDRERQMIRLVGGSRSQVTFEKVELRLELPSDPSPGWALLAIYQVQSLDLLDTVLTVKDAGGVLGSAAHEPVAMLALQPYRPAEMMKMTDDMMAMLPSINVRLSNCVARGEATFLTANEERPLNLIWNQGLLVTPQRLLDTGGCNQIKPSSQDKFEIVLDHVTAIVPSGLVRQRRAPAMPSHLRLEVTCRDSVLQWDREAALFEFEGLASRSDIKLRFMGQNNLYPVAQGLFLRHLPAGGGVSPEPIAFDGLSEWEDDSSSDKIFWNAALVALADKPAHEHLPQHYLLDEGRSGGEGFDLNLLPKLDAPATSSPPAATGTEADFFP